MSRRETESRRMPSDEPSFFETKPKGDEGPFTLTSKTYRVRNATVHTHE
jgi:hypothetical protein